MSLDIKSALEHLEKNGFGNVTSAKHVLSRSSLQISIRGGRLLVNEKSNEGEKGLPKVSAQDLIDKSKPPAIQASSEWGSNPTCAMKLNQLREKHLVQMDETVDHIVDAWRQRRKNLDFSDSIPWTEDQLGQIDTTYRKWARTILLRLQADATLSLRQFLEQEIARGNIVEEQRQQQQQEGFDKLEQVYASIPNPSERDKQHLATAYGLTIKQVQVRKF